MKRFTGKVALITGGGSGIGAAAARRLASEGAHVVVTGRRAQPIEEVAHEINGLAVVGDTRDEAHIAAAITAAIEQFGGLDVLIANAGKAYPGSVTEVDLKAFDDSFEINVKGSLLAARHAVPEMQRRGGGSIVLVSSQAAFVAYPELTPYLTAKAAMLGLSRAIAHDYGPDGIRCNVLCPAWVRSEMTEATFGELAAQKGRTLDDMFKLAMQPTPLRRMASPDEMAGPIAFLASDDASFITGTVIIADGGGAIVDPSTIAILNS